MISRILLRLIDETIVPAILVIATKVIGMWLVTVLFSIEWQVSLSASTTGIQIANREGLLAVNSYSNLLVLVVLMLNLMWVLTKAYHFHETHISPSFTLKLLSLNLTSFISSSSDIYHRALVWLSYLWLVVFLMLLHVILDLAYGWTAAVGVASALFLTWLFINDLEREVRV